VSRRHADHATPKPKSASRARDRERNGPQGTALR
jgi:hypothetical protein